MVTLVLRWFAITTIIFENILQKDNTFQHVNEYTHTDGHAF